MALRMPSPILRTAGLLLSMLASLAVGAAGHREAPLTAIDTKADIIDWFAFVSYDNPTKVTMILNVEGFLHPANGPGGHPFDPEILYEMKVDNTFDASEDIRIQFRFARPEIRLPGVNAGYLGVGTGVNAPANSPPPVAPGTPLVPPAITALDGVGSEGLNLRQSYSVTIQKKVGTTWTTVFSSGVRRLFAVPGQVGPRTMPGYDALARLGVHDLGAGVKVFAGTIDDPFFADIGGTLDTLNFRAGASGTGVPGLLADAQDGDDTRNFAADAMSGFNANTIAIELPIAMLTRDGSLHAASDLLATIGTWATTSRPRIKTQPTVPGGLPALSTSFVQIQRMGHPFVNGWLIGTGDKDRFSMSEPKDDAQFAGYVLDPLLARVINAAYGGAIAIPAPPRTDLLPLLTYAPPVAAAGTPAGPTADMLRLNTGVLPTPSTSRRRLGLLAGDPAGYPNGRRLTDDVSDIVLRAVSGVFNAGFSGFPNNRLGDGVNVNDRPVQQTFPYVPFANSGRDGRKIDPSESGCFGALPPFAPVLCPIP